MLRTTNSILLCLLATLPLLQPRPLIAATEEPAPDTEVAIIGSEHFTFGQLPASAQTNLADDQRRYEQRLRQLAIEHRRAQHALLETQVNNFIDSKLMQAEARARRTTIQELIRQVKNPEVSDDDIRAFYEQHKQEFKQPYEAEMIPITQYLMRQAAEEGKRSYLAGLRTKYSARALLTPLREEIKADGPSRGPEDARVTLVEFADFQCPYCGKMAPVLRRALSQYPHDVRLVYRQMPLEKIHPDAMRAAQASLCALEQGKFWEMHDALFADQRALSVDDMKKTAARVALDTTAFAACLESGRTEAAVKSDAEAGLEYGVDGTPGIFVNGRFINGAVPYERLVAIIDDELQRQQAVASARSAPDRPAQSAGGMTTARQ